MKVTLGARVQRQEIASMFLQLQVNAMLKEGWLMRPWNEATACLVKPDGAGAFWEGCNSLFWTQLHPRVHFGLRFAGVSGSINHLKVDLSVHDVADEICLEVNVVQHVGTVMDLDRMLDGALRREWASSTSSLSALPHDRALVKRVNHALHGWQCTLMPVLVYAFCSPAWFSQDVNEV